MRTGVSMCIRLLPHTLLCMLSICCAWCLITFGLNINRFYTWLMLHYTFYCDFLTALSCILVYIIALASVCRKSPLRSISSLSSSFGLFNIFLMSHPPNKFTICFNPAWHRQFYGCKKSCTNMPLNWTLDSFKHTRDLSGFENIAFF